MSTYVCGIEIEAEGVEHAHLIIKDINPAEVLERVCYDKATVSGEAMVLIIVVAIFAALFGYILGDINALWKDYE